MRFSTISIAVLAILSTDPRTYPRAFDISVEIRTREAAKLDALSPRNAR